MSKIKGKLSKTNAAYEILNTFGKAMTYEELITYAINNEMIITTGKTPAATLRVDIYNEINRRKKSKKRQRFIVIDSNSVKLNS